MRAALDYETKSSNAAQAAFQSIAPQTEALISKLQQTAALNALKFAKIHERFDSITTAEANTYAWLLPQDAEVTNGELTPPLRQHLVHAKKSFLDWLRTGSGFFYTSGKPGAGKSTLMKFICRHQLFHDCASQWAGDAILVIGRFFFWKPGQSEQKSISGMLRGLLYSILETRPDLTSVALPKFCDSLVTDKPHRINDADVQGAFQNMLEAFSKTKSYAIMLIIDGLDEFDGNHSELLTLMQSWVARYPSTIKICVSSREYGIFEDFFRDYPKFRLHELTKDDMALLIASRFSTSKAFAKLPGRDLESITPLITERAEGVFLWVILAISALEDGMEAGDIKTAKELEGCVKRFPSELDDLLLHLHKSVSEFNRPWAYKAITLTHFAQFKVAGLLQSGEGYPGVGVMDFMLLDEASSTWNLTMFAPRSDSKGTDVEERLAAARRKVLCRPKGFLAVSNLAHARHWPANGADKLYITFTHRSIVEFLSSEGALGRMATYMVGFDPFFALASTVLALLRFSPPANYPLLRDGASLPRTDNVGLSSVLAESLMQRMAELIECAASLGKSGSSRFLSILDAIGDAIKRHLTLLLPLRRIRLSPEDNSPHQILVNLTLANHVFEYSEWKSKQPMQSSSKKYMNSSLFGAFCSFLDRCRSKKHRMVSIRGLEGGKPVRVVEAAPSTTEAPPAEPAVTFERLLHVLDEFFKNGLDLNKTWHEACHGSTTTTIEAGGTWTCWGAMLWAMSLGDIPHEEKHVALLEVLLRHGAAADMVMIATEPQGPWETEELEPAAGWYLVTPFGAGDAGPNEGTQGAPVSLGSGGSGDVVDLTGKMLPKVLMHESSPMMQRAKAEPGWRLTLRDLVALKFGDDAAAVEELLNSAKI